MNVKTKLFGFCLMGAALAGALPLLPLSHVQAAPAEKKMVEAAKKFISVVDDAQKSKLLFPFDAEQRSEWYYVPRERFGLKYADMNPDQRAAAMELLKTGLSVKGLKKVETIRQLENVLKVIEKGTGPVRDQELYYFAIFGTPDSKGKWGWRYEGHHCSLHWTFDKGKVVASTPQFMGTNPAEVRIEHPMKGTRVLGTEEDLGYALFNSLSDAQRKECVVDPKAPADVLTTNTRQAAIQADNGVAYNTMTGPQREKLMALIKEIAETQAPEQTKLRLDGLHKAGLDTVKFAWMGSTEKNGPHYWRVQGKTFLIELDNTQNEANHVHLVWRDFNGDFGRDLLAEHYASAPHEHGHDHK